MTKTIYEEPQLRVYEVKLTGRILDGSYTKSGVSMDAMDVDDDEIGW